MSKSTKPDIYQDITDHIIEMLEQNIVPWHMPWKRSSQNALPSMSWPRNATTGRGYNGINVLLLWMAADKSGFDDPRWMTYRQCQGVGGHVQKGQRGVRITFWKAYKDKDDEKKRLVLRTFTVFNIAQCEGVDLEQLPEPTAAHEIEAPLGQEAAAEAVALTGATIIHGGNRACFSPAQDLIMMPKPDQFECIDAYWSTLLHELTHWTGHKDRLARTFGGTFGSHDYAREELVAEMGSAFLCAQLGIPLEGLQHPAYLANWIEVLKEDKRAIMRAASLARKATEYILTADRDEASTAA